MRRVNTIVSENTKILNDAEWKKKRGQNHPRKISESESTKSDVDSDVPEDNLDLTTQPIKHREPFKCDYCDKAFKHQCHLLRHIRCHTGEKTYECAHCNKTFAEKYQVAQHLKVHVETTFYQCNQCNKSFKWKLHFVRHVKLHSKEKSYKCDQCETFYKEKKSFERHLKTHVGEKGNEREGVSMSSM